MSIGAVVRAHVDRDPDREMFTFRDLEAGKDRRFTYGALWTEAAKIAEALETGGVPSLPRPRPRTLIVLPLGPELLGAHLGTILAGGVPVIHSHPSSKVAAAVYIAHLTHVLELLQPDVVITNRVFQSALEQAPGGTHARILALEELPEHTRFEPRAYQSTRAGDLAVIQHSSGSTGLQKGVALTHEMVIAQCRAYSRTIAADPERDRVCSWIPLYHDMGLFTTWLLPLLERVRVAAIDPFSWVQSPAALLRLIHDFRGTLAWQPNFAYNLLATRVRDSEIEGVELGSMRGFTNCSEPVRAASHRVFLERFRAIGVRPESLWVSYAMAENSFAVTAAGDTEGAVPLVVRSVAPEPFAQGRIVLATPGDRAIEVVSVGRAIEQCEVKVVGESRAPLEDGCIGEVALRSPFVLREYFRNIEATKKAIDESGWYYSGDLGFALEGQLYITGRKKDLLIVGGRNFYPQDIEAVADKCPHAVPGRSVAIGVDDEKTGTQRIVVLAESRSTARAEQDELAASIRKRVFEELDCPLSEVHVVPHMWLLKTSSGKIARAPNLERFRAEQAASGPPASAASQTRSPGPIAITASTLFFGFLVALALYAAIALEPNLSWGIYAGF